MNHHGSAVQAPTSAQLSAYTSLLQQAKQVVKQRRRDIQQRQEAVLAAQADWRAVLSAMEEEQQLHAAAGKPVPPELGQAVQQLRQLKGVLQDQIHSLNEETQQVKALKARVSGRPGEPLRSTTACSCCVRL
jgi:DNA repair exonuclease SbcCD ATPase subunit